METLRIAIYSDTYLPTRDGVVTYILTLRRVLEKLGHEVIIATTASHPASINDGHVYASRGYRFPLYPQYKISPIPFSVNKKLSEKRIDIVHSQTPMMMGYAALRFSRLKSIPIVSTFHSLIFDESVLNAYLPDNRHTISTVKRSIRRYLRWYYRNCSDTIVPSDYVRRILSREISVDARVVNNAIDVEKYMSALTKSEARSLLHIDESSRIVMFLGRISREKNLEVLLNAARLTGSDVKYLVIGSGPHLSYYVDMADKLGLKNIEFLGFVEDSIAPLYFRAADIFCNPSNFEVMSTVDVESMAAGTPILVPEGTSQEELLFQGRNGLSFRNGDPVDLSSKIMQMLESVGTFSTVEYAKKFTPEKHVEALLRIYRSLLDR